MKFQRSIVTTLVARFSAISVSVVMVGLTIVTGAQATVVLDGGACSNPPPLCPLNMVPAVIAVTAAIPPSCDYQCVATGPGCFSSLDVCTAEDMACTLRPIKSVACDDPACYIGPCSSPAPTATPTPTPTPPSAAPAQPTGGGDGGGSGSGGGEESSTVAAPAAKKAQPKVAGITSRVRIPQINSIFRSVYVRNPSVSENLYWQTRLKDKPALPAFRGAMAWHKLHNIQH